VAVAAINTDKSAWEILQLLALGALLWVSVFVKAWGKKNKKYAHCVDSLTVLQRLEKPCYTSLRSLAYCCSYIYSWRLFYWVLCLQPRFWLRSWACEMTSMSWLPCNSPGWRSMLSMQAEARDLAHSSLGYL
jgi:hypothetical protein